MHSIPDIINLYVTPVTYTNVIESDTYKGGGGDNSLDDDENNSTEKPLVTVRTEKWGGILLNKSLQLVIGPGLTYTLRSAQTIMAFKLNVA